jgi:hypothetical protein
MIHLVVMLSFLSLVFEV